MSTEGLDDVKEQEGHTDPDHHILGVEASGDDSCDSLVDCNEYVKSLPTVGPRYL